MTRTVELTTYLDAPPDIVWDHVQTPALLDYVAAPILRFVPQAPLPAQWSEGEHLMGMRFAGFMPVGWQVIGIEYPESDDGTMVLRDNGHGPLIKRWDHWITIAPEGEGTRYTDRVHVEAGLLTLPVAAFAKWFYAHRQKRWRELVAKNFAPLSSA